MPDAGAVALDPTLGESAVVRPMARIGGLGRHGSAGEALFCRLVTQPASAILDTLEPDGPRPRVVTRQAGDRAVLIEYGEAEFDLTLNFFALAAHTALAESTPAGVVESAPGFRSLIVTYDPHETSPAKLADALHAVHAGIDPSAGMTIPSRVIDMPVAFDDEQTRAAITRYINSIRSDAPNCADGNNVDYIARYNGLDGREQVYETLLATEQWTGFLGFFPGLPFMFPLDPREVIFVPKYNPTRTWTAEGAVGIGGPCWAIYNVESAGGYQIIGRTIPVYDPQERNEVFRDNGMLLRAGDRVRFHRVEEAEILHLFDEVHADRYRYQIEEGDFDVGEYLGWLPSVDEAARARRQQCEAAAATTPVP